MDLIRVSGGVAPPALLCVADLERSLAFYTCGLGFAVVSLDADAGAACVDGCGYPLLLAGPEARLFPPGAFVVPPGTTVFVAGGKAEELDGLRAAIGARGVDARVVTRPWGERAVIATDPDGYAVSFWTPTTLDSRSISSWYQAGPRALADVLAGLSNDALDRCPTPGRTDLWSIRRIVRHLVDLEAMTIGGMAFPFATETSAHATHDDGSVEPLLERFRVLRRGVSDLLEREPDAWQWPVRGIDSRVVPAGTVIGMLMCHACGHLDDIRAIRRVHEG
jgi:catechol 2,3-dioxygenase-like lactoylglutathione lyase family enzyme